MRMPKLAIVSLFFLPSLTAADIPNVKPDLRTSAQISSLTLNPTTAVGGAAVSGTVTLTQAAGSGGVTVRFQSSNSAIAAVPPNVVVQPGTTSANFMVQTYPVAMNPNVVTDPPSVEISAQIGLTAPAKVRITIQPPAFASISFNPASVPGGTSTVGQVTFSGPAPSSGLTVTLSTTQPGKPDVDLSTALLRDSSKVNFPRQVTVPAGASSATFSAATRGVTEKLIVPIYASYGTFVTKSATLTLNPPAVASLTINPEHPIGGQSVTGTITLTAAAPTDGATISISRSGSGCGPAPTAPPTVQIPAGAASATFPISTYPGMWWGSFYASGKQATIGVREQIITADTLVFPSSVKGGTPVQAKLVFSTPAGPTNCGLSHKLESNNTTIAQVPASVAPSPGATEAPFTITTSAVPSNQTVTITVYGNVGYGYASYQKTLTLTP